MPATIPEPHHVTTAGRRAHRRRLRRRRQSAALVVVAVTGTAACGSSSPEASPSTSAPPTAVTPPASTAPATRSSGTPSSTCVTDVDAVVASTPTAESATASLPDDLVATLDAAAQASFEQAAAPGAIVGVRTPEGTWTQAYGQADPEARTPMTVDMHTRIGSVTKTFTGTVLMQLVEQGQLALDDTIDQYVPDVPNGDRITLRMLADMTSGLASYTTSPAFEDVYYAKPDTVFTPERVLAIGLAGSPIFEPGAEFNYSNTNTVLLGLVIEEVTGQGVADVFADLIFEPLGLEGTSMPGDSTVIPEPYPQGFTLQGDVATPDEPSNATHWNPAWTWTAGELISTMDDLLVYGRALGTGRGLLDAATQAERLTSFPGEAGYGIGMGCSGGWVGHGGELPGYNTSVFHHTTSDTTVIVQTNSDIASGACAISPTLTDDIGDEICESPATRIFVGLSTALGHPFTPVPRR